jgi:hypothetical protein
VGIGLPRVSPSELLGFLCKSKGKRGRMGRVGIALPKDLWRYPIYNLILSNHYPQYPHLLVLVGKTKKKNGDSRRFSYPHALPCTPQNLGMGFLFFRWPGLWIGAFLLRFSPTRTLANWFWRVAILSGMLAPLAAPLSR